MDEHSHSKENPTTMNEPSHENPTAIIEPSTENKARTFSLELKPAGTLRQALLALCDPHLNPKGLATISVMARGLQITVLNAETKVVGRLLLCATDLMNFQFKKTLDSRIGDLRKMLMVFVDANIADDDSVTIYHLVRSTQLSFTFGRSPARVISVDLLGKRIDFGSFLGDLKKHCQTRFPSDVLREMIEEIKSKEKLLQQQPPQLVSMDFTKRILAISVSELGDRKCNFDIQLQEGQTSGIKPEERHSSWFEWAHWDSLKKASYLSEWFVITINSRPPNSIILGFKLQFGSMMYIKRACNILNDHETFGLHVNSSS